MAKEIDLSIFDEFTQFMGPEGSIEVYNLAEAKHALIKAGFDVTILTEEEREKWLNFLRESRWDLFAESRSRGLPRTFA